MSPIRSSVIGSCFLSAIGALGSAQQPPVIDSITSTLSYAPGIVRIQGTGFGPAPIVLVDGQVQTLLFQSDSHVAFQPAAHAPGFADVKVANLFGAATVDDGLELWPALLVIGGELGGELDVELDNGEPGLYALAIGSAVISVPLALPGIHYGLLLDPGQSFGVLANGSFPPGNPAIFSYVVPRDLALSGQSVHFQAWTQQGPLTAVHGQSFSNAAQAALQLPAAPSGLAYESLSAVYLVEQPIPENAPSVTGLVTSYAVSPSLPIGLGLDPHSGLITGTPAQPAPPTIYTVTAANAAGSTSADLQMTVLDQTFFPDPNAGGVAGELGLAVMHWGRLVDVYDYDGAAGKKTLQFEDYVIGAEIQSNGTDYLLETQPVTQQQTLTILHPKGSAAYAAALVALDQDLPLILPKSPTDLPPFSVVPRNATIVLRFTDLLDETTIDSNTIRVLVGVPPQAPFDALIRLDPNHGGYYTAGGLTKFRTTRILIDTTVSEVEALSSNPPLEVNVIGLPPSTTKSQPNLLLRVPTKVDFGSGQFQVLKNASGHALGYDSPPYDFGSATADLVRAMRAGGEAAGDPNGGFLPDQEAPRVLGVQPIAITAVSPDPAAGPGHHLLDLSFTTVACAWTPQAGDTLQLPGVFAAVTQDGTPPSSGQVQQVKVELLFGNASALVPGPAVYYAPFGAGDVPACFTSFFPLPGQPPAAQVLPGALARVRFSEPIDPASLPDLEGFYVTSAALPTKPDQYVLGATSASPNLSEWAFLPALPLSHASGSAESYYVQLAGGSQGATDLAGNPLALSLPPVAFSLDPAAPALKTGGLVLHFNSADEDGNGKPELRGQFFHDFADGILLPRPVTRFTGIADRNNPMVAPMPAFPSGVATPLVPLGGKLMSVWRYPDLGLGSSDEAYFNLDVERLSWAPPIGQVVADFYPGFEMGLAHASRLPDEELDMLTLLPKHPDSGLTESAYDANVLTDPASAKVVVHPKAAGYAILPTNLFLSATGTAMMPWPLNTGPDVSAYQYFTWRDTAIRATGAPNGAGSDLGSMVSNGLANVAGAVAGPNDVPSIGLPLLMEFKCYPADTALGLNALDVSIALNTSSKPNFRIFSSGGVDGSGQPVVKNPDLELVPSGGLCPSPGLCTLGAPTPPADNAFYLGQADFVVRVSRVHTLWFDAQAAAPDYAEPSVAPAAQDQPAGTQIVLAFRGASLVGGLPLADASALDAYGDQPKDGFPPTYDALGSKNPNVSFGAGSPAWSASLQALDGRRYFQARITFVSNTATNQTPALAALGFGWLVP